jgi:hypothetical protein
MHPHTNRITMLIKGSKTLLLASMILFLSGTIMAAPTITVKVDSVSCFGGSNGKIHIKVNSGLGTYTYKLYNGDPLGGGTQIGSTVGPTPVDSVVWINLAANNNYYIYVSDSPPLSYVVQPHPVYQPSQLTPGVITVVQGLTCFNSTDAIFKCTPTGGTPSYTYLWSNGQTTQNAINCGQGIYTVQVRDSKGCGPVTGNHYFRESRISSTHSE